MDEHKKDQPHNGSACGGWCGCGHNHFLLRWILGVFILLAVFSLGVKVGEFKALLQTGGYMGGPYRMYRSHYGMDYYQKPPMMQIPVSSQPNGAAPTTSAR